MKSMSKILSWLLIGCMLLSAVACGNGGNTAQLDAGVGVPAPNDTVVAAPNGNGVISNSAGGENVKPQYIANGSVGTAADTSANDAPKAESNGTQNNTISAPKGEYIEGTVLVKVTDRFDSSALGTVEYVTAEPLYTGSKWYSVQLADASKTEDAVTYLSNLSTFDAVDYDYVMGVGTDGEAKVTDNPDYDKQTNLGLHNIPNGWTHNGKHPGGSADVVIAVIDTGVDYNHLDLRNNIWINTAEIPDNGRDDDGNGYVDDVYGWDCVGNDKDPMDDNGHGTHVAGIIAAENNKIGGIGVAYNCKVMVLKAGNSSGYFNNSDIAEAVQYAYMNGASVINMSFGGSQISMAVEEALQAAYNTCVLVAAAGNDGACNNLECEKQACIDKRVCYPGALSYVIGVMSTNANGQARSSFSNYDHYPYGSIEYEVYAVGEAVKSTWPNNKYATLNGTSMAAPTVAGIAALVRSYYSDREMYSTKFVQSQIVNTGSVCIDGAHTVADVYEALTKLPKPTVNLYDFSIDDSTAISEKNNGNGVVDAGETIRLYFSLHNRGGVASNVNVSIDTYRREIGNEALTDPYFTFVNPTMQLSDIGTYSVRESGDKYFEIVVSPDCPNDYLVIFNIRFTYENGLDDTDKMIYADDGSQKVKLCVSNGIYLPLVISEDTVLRSDRLYFVPSEMYIKENVILTVDAGAKIISAELSSTINNAGRIVCNGSKERMIRIQNVSCYGYAECNYVEFDNAYVDNGIIDHCIAVNNSNLNGKVSNSKFVNSGAGGDIEHCQMVKGKEMSFNCSPYSTYDVETITNYKNCVFLAEDCTITATIRPAITLERCGSMIHTEDKTYIGINCTFEGAHPYCNPIGLMYEANLFASYFGGRIATLSNEQASALGVTSYVRAGHLTVLHTTKKALILFEVDNTKSISETEILEAYAKYCEAYAAMPYFKNTAILSSNAQITMGASLEHLEEKYRYNLANVYWGTNDLGEIQSMMDGYDKYGLYSSVMPEAYLEEPTEDMWPMVSDMYILNKDGERVDTIGTQTVKFVVEFNRDMNTAIPLSLTFGTVAPYADYQITGEWITARQWVGEYTLKSSIENGKQFVMITNAQAADDSFFTAEDKTGRFTFAIDTTSAMSMNLIANPIADGIELTVAQDDYDTLLGYNVYRADSKDGNYIKLNPTILLPTDSTFLDENAEPGKTYWYTYTVVLTDFTESNPAGKVVATAMDTMSPSLYHTPVNQGYENNNLVISCTASDNVAIRAVTLYYRAVGATEWQTLAMNKQNDKYSATIFGSDVTMAGIEYYIVAKDGRNTVTKGTADTPYHIVVKSVDTLLGKGDVDGNGTVTTKDALMLMQCLNGDLILTDDAFKRADLNGDGILSSAEALRILQYINGKVNTLDM